MSRAAEEEESNPCSENRTTSNLNYIFAALFQTDTLRERNFGTRVLVSCLHSPTIKQTQELKKKFSSTSQKNVPSDLQTHRQQQYVFLPPSPSTKLTCHIEGDNRAPQEEARRSAGQRVVCAVAKLTHYVNYVKLRRPFRRR